MKFGLWDTTGQAWLGQTSGPILYEDKELARAAAMVASEQLGYAVIAIPFNDKKLRRKLRIKDKVTPRMSAIEAIKKIEGRR